MDTRTQITTIPTPHALPSLSAIVTASGRAAPERFLEFFAATLRNPHTYARQVMQFLAWWVPRRGGNGMCTDKPTVQNRLKRLVKEA